MEVRKKFHHPDISLPVIRRRIGNELLGLFAGYAEVLVTRGRSIAWNKSYPDRISFNCAVHRLKKAGLVARTEAGTISIHLDRETKAAGTLKDILNPQKRWRSKWNGIWHLITYDVPEEHRPYRSVLRRFLKRLRMGCLHNSVYLTPRDIRPEFADLCEAAKVERYAYLFESRTVLGLDPIQVVTSSWDFERLREIQGLYCEVYRSNLDRLRWNSFSAAEIETLAREEMSAYRLVMEEDPLLPEELHPPSYLGKKVHQIHRAIVLEIGQRL